MYGSLYATGGNAFAPSDMQMGVVDTAITALSLEPHTTVSETADEEDGSQSDAAQAAADPIASRLNPNAPVGNAALENGKLDEADADKEDENNASEAENDGGQTDAKSGDAALDESADKEDSPVILIRGENFTPWSKVYINGEAVTTTCVSDTALEISPDAVSDGCTLIVNQVGSGGTIFRQSNTITIPSASDPSVFDNDPSTSSGRYSVTSGEEQKQAENTLQTVTLDKTEK
jgi:hypothetical protein